MIRAAIGELERVLFPGMPSALDVPPPYPWSGDIPGELRSWLEWTPPADATFYVPLRSGGGVVTGRSGWENADWREDWAAGAEAAAEGGRPFLLPVFRDFFVDRRDGSIWWRELASEPRYHREDDSLVAFLERITRFRENPAASPWRRMRVVLPPNVRLAPANAPSERMLAEAPVGTMLVVARPGMKRAQNRGRVVLKVGPSQWIRTSNRWWDAEAPDPEAPEKFIDSFRYELATGSAWTSSDFELADALASDLAKPGASLHRAEARVYTQAPVAAMLQRMAALLPDWRAALNAPATDAEIAAAEAQLGCPLPDDLRALYRFGNGGGGSWYWALVFMPLEAGLATNAMLRELRDRQFGPEYWPDAALPFLDASNADCIYVDIAGAHGEPGAVVDFNHEEPQTRKVLFRGVAEWLECFVDGIESGLYVTSPGGRGLFPRGFLDTGDVAELYEHQKVRTSHDGPYATVKLTLRDD